jgi:IclR family pca regulon transcriptional regulator
VQLTPHTVVDTRRLRRIVDEVRAQGYAYVEQELELGLCSLAVPVHNADGRIATAINVSFPYYPDAAREALQSVLPQLQLTASAIETCMPSHRLPAVSP